MNTLDQISFNQWLGQNAWWLALIFAALIAVTIVAIFLSGKKKSKKEPSRPIDQSAYLLALGGIDNVEEKSLTGSRIVLKLKDTKKVDQEKLKEIGVDGFIVMSEKLTLVFKKDADKAFEAIFGKID